MIFAFDGRAFDIVVGSDVIDDGMYLEARDANEKVVLFAFYYDQTGRFTFSMYEEELPFELVETFIEMARKHLPSI